MLLGNQLAIAVIATPVLVEIEILAVCRSVLRRAYLGL